MSDLASNGILWNEREIESPVLDTFYDTGGSMFREGLHLARSGRVFSFDGDSLDLVGVVTDMPAYDENEGFDGIPGNYGVMVNMPFGETINRKTHKIVKIATIDSRASVNELLASNDECWDLHSAVVCDDNIIFIMAKYENI